MRRRQKEGVTKERAGVSSSRDETTRNGRGQTNKRATIARRRGVAPSEPPSVPAGASRNCCVALAVVGMADSSRSTSASEPAAAPHDGERVVRRVISVRL